MERAVSGLAGEGRIREDGAMQNHTWRERDEEGGLTFFKATHHGGRWTLASQEKEEDEWTKHDPIPEDLLEKLRDVLFKKYQRGRCAWKLVTGIDKLLGRDPVDPKQG